MYFCHCNTVLYSMFKFSLILQLKKKLWICIANFYNTSDFWITLSHLIQFCWLTDFSWRKHLPSSLFIVNCYTYKTGHRVDRVIIYHKQWTLYWQQNCQMMWRKGFMYEHPVSSWLLYKNWRYKCLQDLHKNEELRRSP